MIIIDMLGVMFLWHIELNAISVVNIVMVGVDNDRYLHSYLVKRLIDHRSHI
jgi:hypothetical protein